MFDVITIGSATRDVFLRSKAWETHKSNHSPTGLEQCLPLGSKVPVDEIHFTTGGGATNAAVTFSRLGRRRVATICRIGALDTGGQAVLADLKAERVDVHFIQRDPKLHTGYSLILLAGSGERTILVHGGASHAIGVREIPWKQVRAKRFYLTSLGGDLALADKILAHATRIGARVAWNPGGAEIAHGWKRMAPLIAQCEIFNLNREEAAALTGLDPKNLKGILAKLYPTPSRSPSRGEGEKKSNFPTSHREGGRGGVGRITIVTDGSGGAYAHDGHTTWHIASRRLKATNTTGAGDAFGSAFFLGLDLGVRKNELGYSLDYALRLAMANAEGVITHMGAKAGILSRVPSRSALAKYRVRAM